MKLLGAHPNIIQLKNAFYIMGQKYSSLYVVKMRCLSHL